MSKCKYYKDIKKSMYFRCMKNGTIRRKDGCACYRRGCFEPTLLGKILERFR